MGVVAVVSRPQRALVWCAAALYAAVTALAVFHHEPWADEAQAWLLARDAGLVNLWTKLLAYEGSPGLWHTLLHLLIALRLPYSGLNVVSAALGLISACLILWRAPWPWAIRVGLPFTFFLCFQYAVVARSYSLIPPILFSCALLRKRADESLWPLTLLLCVLAATSVHGMALSLAIYLTDTPFRSASRKTLLFSASVYTLFVSLMVTAAWPAPNAAFVTHPNLSATHMLEVAGKTLSGAFTGHWMLSLAAIALSVPFLWRGKSFFVFALSASALCLIGSVIYSQVWHQGIVFLAWIYAVWIAGCRVRPTAGVLAAMGLVIAIQSYWTYRSVRYDWNHSYSGSFQAARYLQRNGIQESRLFGVGYACVGIQPYFPRNIFTNMNGGGPQAYWDWSSLNHVNGDSTRLRILKPDFVVVGYKSIFERNIWTSAVTQSGFELQEHFEGYTFWQTRTFEPESFDLYRPR